MPTKTFSGRAELDKLAYADALAMQEYGISYGQFCSSILLDFIQEKRALPAVGLEAGLQQQRIDALKRLRAMGKRLEGSKLATMSDEEMKQQIASRYA